jgi:hypothetical protein
MKIEKTDVDGIKIHTLSLVPQHIYFDNETERDIVFKHWNKAIEELEESKAIFRPVYESESGEIRILTLRYTTPEEAISIENRRREHFQTTMKLVMIYNELERSFINVN